MKTRKLHAYPAGDFWRGKVVPMILLKGKWLEQAGFEPGVQVVVEVLDDGKLLVRRTEEKE